ncbi:zinc finger protein 37 homolog isoform X2 [Dunckerocampus dactyliophorus]|uniref:zinc finger protein 37 homolog isoform X2 n=1 Tax=Dunckerocampus dactyliophorus TaxID=161453 RepID=UPI002406AD80|nr:zinc finger protein 37 homolog isoform X2 [Dunckerocampus dactyliophorus]
MKTQLLDVMETVVKTAMYKVTQLVEDGFLDEMKRKNREVETLRMKLQCAERKLSVKEGGVCVDIAGNDTVNASEDLQDDVLMDCGVERERDSTGRSVGTQRCEMKSDEAPAVLPSPEEDTHTMKHTDGMPVVKEEVGLEDVRTSAKPLSVEMDAGWTGQTLHHQRLGTDRECEPTKAKVSPQRAGQELEDYFADGNMSPVTRDRLCSSSSKTRLQHLASLGVSIKQEMTVDSHGAEDIKQVRKEATTNSGIASVSCAIKRNRLSSLAPKHNTSSCKPTAQQGIKVNSKQGTCDRLQAAMKHLIRPVKKPTPALCNTSYSQALDPLNRNPSTSKATPPAALPRTHPANKVTLSRTGPPCVTNRPQPQCATSHHAHPSSHPDGVLRHPLRCGHCDRCFPHLSNLKAHLQTHTGERPFCCSLCGRSFTKLSNLKAHRRVHTGERPYCCLACGKRFTQKCNLKRHQRIHVDE